MHLQGHSNRIKRADRRLPFECIALLLQGGGAMGAYQAGVYEGLAEANIHPDWVAGISIGAINAAIIAGNPSESRVDRMRDFWMRITAPGPWHWSGIPFLDLAWSDYVRNFLALISGSFSAACGANEFFSARPVPPWLQANGTNEATSFYDTSALKSTLERLVDFDRLNAAITRFSAGAVNVSTGGSLVYFDNSTNTIRPEHIMASGALPPGFPAVEVDGEHYCDGGLVSNTPLERVIKEATSCDMLAFHIDLCSAQGPVPRNIAEVVARKHEIQYSSRVKASTDQLKREQLVRRALATLLNLLPEYLCKHEDVRVLRAAASKNVYSIIRLIYNARNNEDQSRCCEFSRRSMEDLWRAGYRDASRTLSHPEALTRPTTPDGIFTFDAEQYDRE